MYRKLFIVLAALLTLAACSSEKEPVVNYKLHLDWQERHLHAFYDYKTNLCIDVMAVKPGKREVHTFRIGAGGKDFDFFFGY